MTIQRRLALAPKQHDFDQLAALTRTRYPNATAVNEVDNQDGTTSVAVYWDNWAPTAASVTAWQADISAAVIQHPTAAEAATTAAGNRDQIDALLAQAMADLAATITQQQQVAATMAALNVGSVGALGQVVTATGQQATAIAANARTLRRAIRLLRGDLSATD